MTEDRVLSMVETEKLVLIALTAQGVAWWTPSHYRALIRLGGTKQTAHDANSMALENAATFGLAVQGTANIDELCQSAARVLGGRSTRYGTGVRECLDATRSVQG